MARFSKERLRGLQGSNAEYIDVLTDALGVLRDNIGERYIVKLRDATELNPKSTEARRKKYAGDMQIEILPRPGDMFDDITQEQVDHQRMINREMKLANEKQLGTLNGEALRNVVQYRHKPTWETKVLEKAIDLGVIHPSSIAMFTQGGLRGRQGQWTDQMMGDKFSQSAMDMGQGIDVLYGGPISRIKNLDAGHIYSHKQHPELSLSPDNTRWEDAYDNGVWQEHEGSHLYRNVLKSIISAGRV